ncbi:MAG: hypothetical protein V3U54_08800 [Thermodesulfobacteriota bacterium]
MEENKENREEVWKGILLRCFAQNPSSLPFCQCIGCRRNYIKTLLEQYVTTGKVNLGKGINVEDTNEWVRRFFQQIMKRKRMFTNFQSIEILDAYGLNEVKK